MSGGWVTQADRERWQRAAFTAWQQALGLEDVLEVPAADGGCAVWLRAAARRGSVRVTVTAVAAGEGAS